MSSQSYLTFARPLPEPLLLVSTEAVVLDVNPSAAQMLHRGLDTLGETSLMSLITDPAEKVEEYLQRCASSGSFIPGTLCFRLPDGQTMTCRCEGALAQLYDQGGSLWVLLRCTPQKQAVNQFLVLNEKMQELAKEVNARQQAETMLRQNNETLEQRVITRTVDLTATNWKLAQEAAQRKEIEGALRESEARIRAIVDNAAVGIITIDEQGKVEAFNTAAENIFGYSSPEVLGKNINGLMPFPYGQEHDEHLQRYRETGQRNIIDNFREMVGKRKDGSTFPMELHVSEVVFNHQRLFTGIIRDLTEIKQARDALEAAHKQLVDASRDAGMASVATSVLHNVGNVLTSVNVSASIVAEKVRGSKISAVAKVARLLHDHAENLGEFMTEDERGREFPSYLEMLGEHLASEQSTILDNLQSLTKDIDHIKQIVSMQQSYAKKSDVIEDVSIAELLEDAIRMNAASFDRHKVQVIRQYDSKPIIHIDKHALLQVLVNLIRNAKHAVTEHHAQQMQITLRITSSCENDVQIEVTDTGIGIPEENLAKIFVSGFTTKKEGHGFGLHSSAIAIQDMGGTLVAHSDGPGTGATFTLKLPVNAKKTQETGPPKSSESIQLTERR